MGTIAPTKPAKESVSRSYRELLPASDPWTDVKSKIACRD